MDGLVSTIDFVTEVKKYAKLERLKKTIEDILMMIEDVSVYVIDHESTGTTGTLALVVLWCDIPDFL